MEKRVIITNGVFFVLDFIQLFIDGFFHKALKEVTNATGILSKDEADELKAPVLAFVVLATIASLMNIFVILSFTFGGQVRYEQVKQKWSIIASGLFAWFVDFPQIVIALTVAFKVKEGLIGTVQFVKPVFGLIKAILQLCAPILFHCDTTSYTQLLDIERDEEEKHVDRKPYTKVIRLLTFLGNIANLFCSFVLLVRVSKFM